MQICIQVPYGCHYLCGSCFSVKNNVSTESASYPAMLSISASARPRSLEKTRRRMTPSSLGSSRQLVSLAYKKIQSYTRLRLGVVFLWVFRGSTSQPIWTSLAILLAPWIPSEGPHSDRELALNTPASPPLSARHPRMRPRQVRRGPGSIVPPT